MMQMVRAACFLPRGETERRLSEAQTHCFQAKAWLEAALAEAERYLPQYQDTRERIEAALSLLADLVNGPVLEALAAAADEQEAAEYDYRQM